MISPNYYCTIPASRSGYYTFHVPRVRANMRRDKMSSPQEHKEQVAATMAAIISYGSNSVTRGKNKGECEGKRGDRKQSQKIAAARTSNSRSALRFDLLI